MQTALAFVEYLVTGCCTLLWLMPLLMPPTIPREPLVGVQQVALLPVAYVLGILVDVVALMWLSPFRRMIKRRVGAHGHITGSDKAFLAWHSPELAKECQVRSMRARVARGATMNTVALIVVVVFRRESLAQLLGATVSPRVAIPVLCGIACLCFATWWHSEYLSTRFRRDAINLILEQRMGGAETRETPNKAVHPTAAGRTKSGCG